MFRFTIRDVLWLMVVVALAGWFVDRTRQVGRYERLNYAVRNSNGGALLFGSDGELITFERRPPVSGTSD